MQQSDINYVLNSNIQVIIIKPYPILQFLTSFWMCANI